MTSMKYINFEEKDAPIDKTLLGTTILLVFFGIVMVFSASSAKLNAPYYYFIRQCISASVGIGIMLFFAFISRSIINKMNYWFIAITIILLYLTLSSYGIATSKNVARWIPIGPFTLQPFEFIKPALALYLGYFISTKQQYKDDFSHGALPLICVVGIISFPLYIQPDIGGMLTIILFSFIICFIGNIKCIYLIGTCAAIAPILGVMIYTSKSYAIERLIGFFYQSEHTNDYSFQIVQSLNAFWSGGLSGVGLGNRQIKSLPAAHTDFIMSVLGEELGFIGITVIMVLFGTIFYRCYRIVIKQNDLRDRISACGLSLILCMGAIFNLAVVLGAVPAKGVAMPFLSYGGSSLVASLLCVGLLLNYSKTAR